MAKRLSRRLRFGDGARRPPPQNVVCDTSNRPLLQSFLNPDHYNLIVIGSGPGGASLAQRLAPAGKRILILERGEYLPREEANWSAKAVFVEGKYQADETWTNAKGDKFPSRSALLCRGQFQGIRRRAFSIARTGL